MTRILTGTGNARIVGTGTATPSTAGVGTSYTNAEIHELLLGADAPSILADRGRSIDDPDRRWGVQRRSWLDPVSGEISSRVTRLGAAALDSALEDAALGPTDVDLLLAATSTPVQISKAQAAMIGKRAGIDAPCIDVRAGGAGAIDAMLLAARVLAEDVRTIAIVSSETTSLYVDRTDLATATLYGDGAAAVIIRHDPGTDAGPAGAVLGRRDAEGRPFTIPGDLPPTEAAISGAVYRWQKPDSTYSAALDAAWRDVCTGLATAFGDLVADVAAFVPYAITRTQVETAAATLGVGAQRTVHTLADHGCVGCPSPLIGLDRARRTGAAERGDLVATAAVAGGITMTAMVWQL